MTDYGTETPSPPGATGLARTVCGKPALSIAVGSNDNSHDANIRTRRRPATELEANDFVLQNYRDFELIPAISVTAGVPVASVHVDM